MMIKISLKSLRTAVLAAEQPRGWCWLCLEGIPSSGQIPELILPSLRQTGVIAAGRFWGPLLAPAPGVCVPAGLTDPPCVPEVAYSQSTGQKEQLSRCLQRGIRRVQDLCKVLKLPAAFEETAVSYFQRALELPAFHLVSLEKKELLGGCCVLVTCRQRRWPLTMGTVSSLLYAKQELFASVFLSLQRELGLSVPALSLADLVTTHLSSFRLVQPSANIPAPFLEDKEQLVGRTMGCQGSVSQGSVSQQCQGSVSQGSVSQQCQGSVSQGSVSQECPDQNSVSQGSLDEGSLDKDSVNKDSPSQGCPGQGSVDPGSMDKNSPGQDSPSQVSMSQVCLNQDSVSQGSVDPGSMDQNSVNKDSPGRGCPAQSLPSSPAVPQQQGCPSAGQQQHRGALRPLLPPCLLPPRKGLRAAAPSAVAAALTGDEPISDSEIEQYLRSPEEICAFRRAKAWS
ncbi:transcription factor IIIB 50 kDa subunit [Geospiza fortis]|uniref:Transcription factor IIIB 50 kDa subunit n=1 Tax=Geospiza fortis TaxID=48883 RepID=A0A8N5F2H6_GEOFO|nr:transcription factor IIIB 50 kDa subunit [Geospiza fortis]